MIITIDQKLAKSFNIVNNVNVFSDENLPPPKWALEQGDFLKVCGATVNAKKRIASLYAKNIYSSKLNCSPESAELLFYPLGNSIVFLLCDRLYRLNKLFEFSAKNDLAILKSEFQLNNTYDVQTFQFNLIEKNANFNQWILFEILKNALPIHIGAQQIAKQDIHAETKTIKLENKTKKNFKSAFSSVLAKVVTALQGRYSHFIVDLLPQYHYSLLQKISRICDLFNISPKKKFGYISFGPLFGPMLKKGRFLGPFGHFKCLPSEFPDAPSTEHIKRSDLQVLECEIAQIFYEFCGETSDKVNLPKVCFSDAAALVKTLLSTKYVEKAKTLFDWSVEQITHSEICGLVNWSAVGSDLYGFFSAATKSQNLPIVGHQHSAWGGYLAGGPLVTELLLLGNDYYITFGWDKAEEYLSRWKTDCLPLSSPLLSEYHRSTFTKKNSAKKLKKKILLATGFLYRFPMIYNSSLRIDNIQEWKQIVSKILAGIVENEVEVYIKMYNKTVNEEWPGLMEAWTSLCPRLIHDYELHNLPLREFMRSGRFSKEFDLILWDVPTGGFTEALSLKLNSFSIWSDKLLIPLESAQSSISQLRESGVFVSSQEDAKRVFHDYYATPNWFEQEKVQVSIGEFMNTYCNINYNWHHAWDKTFVNLKQTFCKS